MSYELLESTKNAVKERNTKLKSVLPNFKSILDKLKDANVSHEFWIKERENIKKANKEAREWEESTKMSFEKYHQEFTI